MSKKKFLQYEIELEIGRGGMGVVYKAQDLKLDRTVAIKIIQGQGAIPEKQARRFIEEIKAISQLNHPNIINLFDANIHPFPYYVMEYVNGVTLSQWIQKNNKNYHDLVGILIQVAKGLSCIHNKQIIHRDIKPDNIMIVGNKAKIMDFGLAKNLLSEHSLSKTGTILGTPRYLSPEQIQGHDVDQRTDIYSLGIALYECLTGNPVFQVSSYVNLLYQIVNYKIEDPRISNPDIPIDLETICLKCISKRPEQRYFNAEELINDLQNFLENKTILRPKNYSLHSYLRSTLQKYIIPFALVITIFLLIWSTFFEQQKIYPNTSTYQAPNIFLLSEKLEYPDSSITLNLIEYYSLWDNKREDKLYFQDTQIKKGKLLYQLRQLKKEYQQQAFDCWLSLERNYNTGIVLIEYYLYNENYDDAARICQEILTISANTKKKEIEELLSICRYAQGEENISINLKNSYAMTLLAQQQRDTYQQEDFLRMATMYSPKTEKFYLDLIRFYWQNEFYEGIEILYSEIKKQNYHCVEADFYMSEVLSQKQKEVFPSIREQMENSDWKPSEKISLPVIPQELKQQIYTLENKYNEELWQRTFNSLEQLTKQQNSVWVSFQIHNCFIRLFTVSKKENREVEALEHFAKAQKLIKDHYFTFICIGYFYLQQQNIKEALFYWHQAKVLFPPCQSWINLHEDFVCRKLLINESK